MTAAVENFYGRSCCYLIQHDRILSVAIAVGIAGMVVRRVASLPGRIFNLLIHRGDPLLMEQIGGWISVLLGVKFILFCIQLSTGPKPKYWDAVLKAYPLLHIAPGPILWAIGVALLAGGAAQLTVSCVGISLAEQKSSTAWGYRAGMMLISFFKWTFLTYFFWLRSNPPALGLVFLVLAVASGISYMMFSAKNDVTNSTPPAA